jgi:hypothetical protein
MLNIILYIGTLFLSKCSAKKSFKIPKGQSESVYERRTDHTIQFYGRPHDLVDRYEISVSQMTIDMFHLSQKLPGSFLIHDLLPGLQLD